MTGAFAWFSHLDAPYQWTRQGNTYTNAFYGLEVTKKEQWLRYTEGDSLGVRILFSQFFESPVPFLFPKKNLIEFHRFGDTQFLDAIVFIGPVDDLKNKPYGRSLELYARVSLEAMAAPKKMWLKYSQIEWTTFQGMPAAKMRISYESPPMAEIELKGEWYLFMRGGKGFLAAYSAVSSEFEKYRAEAMDMIESVRFMNTLNEGQASK